MIENMDFETDVVEALEDGDLPQSNSVVNFVEDRFHASETKKMSVEYRLLQCYRNFRGAYGPDVQFTETEKSRVFIKVTKTKVLAAYGQIIDVLFGTGDFPISVDSTLVPDGIADSVSFDQQGVPSTPQPTPMIGPEPLAPGTTQNSLMKLGPLATKLAPVQDKLVPGVGTTPSAVTFHPAHVAAKKMEKTIKDQIEEGSGNKHLRSAAFECALFGTGIIKGPFVENKEYPNWEGGEYKPLIKKFPKCNHVSIWNFYPDPDAYNMDEAEWAIERHKLSTTQLKALNRRPYFMKEAIKKAIDLGYNYHPKYWETDMDEEPSGHSVERYEVLEYWGYVPKELLQEHDVPIPRTFKDVDQINVNIWICNNEVLRIVLNPFKPTRIPYMAVPYELNPYSFFGIGVAENMEDTQLLMNGFMRMAVDNAVLSGNLLIEVDETNLVAGQDMNVYPGKIFRRDGGPPGQSIFGTKWPNVSQENMMMFDKARVLADESTGIPSFSHGQTGVSGVGRTASGISMLMGAANNAIKTVIKNFDDYLIGPMGKAYYAFNMQFNPDPDIKGDLEINARGTESFMVTEVRSQRLMQFLQVVSNPILAPFAKLDVLISEIAASLDLDAERLVNSLPDAAVQAAVIQQMSAMTQAPQGGSEAPPAGLDTSSGPGSGGGTMGTGSAAAPGESGFSGNVQ